jgi:hypothetical protein
LFSLVQRQIAQNLYVAGTLRVMQAPRLFQRVQKPNATPVSLADSMLEFAQQTGGCAKFSVFTSDVVKGEPCSLFASPKLNPSRSFCVACQQEVTLDNYTASDGTLINA